MSRALALLALLVLVLAGCGGTDAQESKQPTAERSPSASPSGHAGHSSTPAASATAPPLRAGERRTEVRMPAAYTPSAPTGKGTDDYRCFLLDPRVARDSFVTGFDVRPGNPEVVHHVILFRVPADQVARAERTDRESPGQGWTCFGGAGLAPEGRTMDAGSNPLDDAPWLGAWAPGGSEQVYAAGFGAPLEKGARVVMQVHYNLAAGQQPDTSATELRLTSDPTTEPLVTQLFPGPVELPCRAAYDDGPLCDRAAALADVKERFGEGPGSLADGIHFLCGEIDAGSEQTCTRVVTRPETVRGVAGHMHLLGREISVVVNEGRPGERTLLDVPVWDFDDQSSRPVDDVRLSAGDTVTVRCRHDQSLRDRLPAFEGQPDRYVLWGEGTTDEMCLGILQVTRG